MIFRYVLLVLVLFSGEAHSDCASNPPSDPNIECFDNSNSPPAKKYRFFLMHIFHSSVDEHADDMGEHLVKAGLTPNMNSKDVVKYFINSLVEIQGELADTQKRTLCIDGKPRFSGEQNILVINQFRKLELVVYEKHRMIARADLMGGGLYDLDKALDELPFSFIEMTGDHQSGNREGAPDIDQIARDLCAGSWDMTFRSKVPEDNLD